MADYDFKSFREIAGNFQSYRLVVTDCGFEYINTDVLTNKIKFMRIEVSKFNAGCVGFLCCLFINHLKDYIFVCV